MKSLSDNELLQRCLQGDPEAWAQFVERFSGTIHGAIYATLRRYAPELVSPERARDLFQQVFLALCENDRRRLRSFRGKGGCSLAGWLRVATTRLVIDQLRRREPAGRSLDVDPAPGNRPGLAPPDRGPLAPEILEEREAVAFLRRELESLPPRERLIMQLRFADGLPGREVARLVGISRNNLDQIVHRIKARLKKRAREQGYV